MQLIDIIIGFCFVTIPLLYIAYQMWIGFKGYYKYRLRLIRRNNRLKRRLLFEFRANRKYLYRLHWHLQEELCATDFARVDTDLKQINLKLTTLLKQSEL